MLATILTLALLAGTAMAIDIPNIPTPAILSQVDNTPVSDAPAQVVPSMEPPSSAPPADAIRFRDIVPEIDPALTAAGVTGSGTKADEHRYDAAVQSGRISADITYPLVNLMSKQASYAYLHSVVYWPSPNGKMTILPLAATMTDKQFNTWYRASPYANPFVVLR